MLVISQSHILNQTSWRLFIKSVIHNTHALCLTHSSTHTCCAFSAPLLSPWISFEKKKLTYREVQISESAIVIVWSPKKQSILLNYNKKVKWLSTIRKIKCNHRETNDGIRNSGATWQHTYILYLFIYLLRFNGLGRLHPYHQLKMKFLNVTQLLWNTFTPSRRWWG